jgi:hypothetical protein
MSSGGPRSVAWELAITAGSCGGFLLFDCHFRRRLAHL